MITEDSAARIFDRVTTAVLGNFVGVKASAQALHIIEETKEVLEEEYGFDLGSEVLRRSIWASHEQVRRILEKKS